MKEIIAQIIGIVVLVVATTACQIKNMKVVLIFEMASNALVVINYALLGGLNGSLVCLLAIAQTFVIYQYTSRGKDFPKPLMMTFIGGYLALSIYSFLAAKEYPSSLITEVLIRLLDPTGTNAALPRLLFGISVAMTFACGVLYSLSVSTKDSSVFRKYSLFNGILWVIYDIYTGAYTTILTHGFITVSCIIGMIRYDRKKDEAPEETQS